MAAHGLTATRWEGCGVLVTYEGLGEPSPIALLHSTPAEGWAVSISDADGSNGGAIAGLTAGQGFRLALAAVYARTCALVDLRHGHTRPPLPVRSDR